MNISTIIRTPSLLVTTAIALTLLACGGMPRQDTQLDQARAAVAAAHSDAQVTGEAQTELTKADAALASANSLMLANKPLAAVEHQAFMADRYARAAQQHGQLIASNQAIAEFDNRRNAVLLDARENDAHKATVVAERKTLEASVARAEAADSARASDMANERADRLSAELADLKAKPSERGMVVTLGDVLFATGKSDLQQGSLRSVAGLTTFLSAHPQRSVRIEGFTDNVGPDDYNRGLSNRRAESVADALTHGGIQSTRIQTQGYGMAFPVADNGSAGGRQQNRRVEVIVSEDDRPVIERTH